MEHCPRLCGRRRDSGFFVERELAHFLRAVMKFLYLPTTIPAEYDIAALLKTVDQDCVEVDSNLYRWHFGQYFRFDISTQLPFFYECVQKLLMGMCRGLTGLWQRTWPHYLSLTPFDPVLVHSGSEDRRVDCLVDSCAVLASHEYIEPGDGGVVQRQYKEVTQFFKNKWSSLGDVLPVVEDVIALWFSYPYWDRCKQLKQVVDLVVSVVFVDSYCSDFIDDSNTALDADELASGLHFVRSWLSHSFVGQPQQSLHGLLRLVDTTVMQDSRLADVTRAKPWDQLLKIGLDQTLSCCLAVMDSVPDAPIVPVVDNYRSDVLAQLTVMEVMTGSPKRATPIAKVVKSGTPRNSKGPRKQSEVSLKTPKMKAGESVSKPKSTGRSKTRKTEGSQRSDMSGSKTGRRTGERPRGKKNLTLSVVAGERSVREDEVSSEESNVGCSKRTRSYEMESSDEHYSQWRDFLLMLAIFAVSYWILLSFSWSYCDLM